jgi:hypothetical protein
MRPPPCLAGPVFEVHCPPPTGPYVVAQLWSGPDAAHLCACGSVTLPTSWVELFAGRLGCPLVLVPDEAADLHNLHPEPGDAAPLLPAGVCGFVVEPLPRRVPFDAVLPCAEVMADDGLLPDLRVVSV